MKILFVVPYTPTLIRTRPYNLIRALARRGHSLTLATLWETDEERQSLTEWTDNRIRVISAPLTKSRLVANLMRGLVSHQPLQSLYCWQPVLARSLASEIPDGAKQYDVVHVEHLRGARYALQLKAEHSRTHRSNACLSARTPIVWDSVDCISFLFEQASQTSRSPFGRFVARLELPRTRWHEAQLSGCFDRVLVTSEKDRQALADLCREFAASLIGYPSNGNIITVLPNGVDLEYFAPKNTSRRTRTLILTGKMGYHANITAALYLVNEVMPRVWERIPDVRVQIVGYKPSREVMNLARQCPQRVQVTGGVADLRPYLAQATVSVAPILYGAGIQNKVLEAMAMATPVVATSIAVSALSVRDEDEVLIADDSEAFAHQIVRLLHTPSLCERIGQNGRRYVELNHDWNRIAEQLEEIYAATIATCA
jgi:glycosyltransferase involved in cell wall biosynthesis